MEPARYPLGPPEPANDLAAILARLGALGTAIVSGGAVLALLSSSAGVTRGARTSARLQWSQRQAEVQQAVQQQETPAEDPKHE